MRGWRGCTSAAAVSVLAIGLASCGSNAPVALPSTGASMEGTVKYDGKTLHFGLVSVETDSGSAQGPINQDGTYKVDNVPVGNVRIAVVTDPGMARSAQMQAGMMKGIDKGGVNKVNVEYVEVPKKYHDGKSSGLSYTTVAGVNKHDIVLPK